MRILVITLNAWNDTGSTGNTISNVFAGAEGVQFANLYCRDESINNKLCNNYYRITENQIIQGLLGKGVGTPFHLDMPVQSQNQSFNPLSNGGLGNFLRKYRPSSLMLARELIWALPLWKNKVLNAWLTDFGPDVIYMHGHANIYMHRIMEYCAKVTGAKVVMFYGDDMYGRKLFAPIGYLYETLYRRRLRRSVALASLLFGGSIKLCDEYAAIFGKKFVPMFKQCDLSGLRGKKHLNSPLTIVYAGNLLFGREKAMCELVEVIKRVNNQLTGNQLKLVIYSNTLPGKNSMSLLDDKVNSIYIGCKPYSEVCAAMNEADMSLFLESFENDNIKKTRLSFSTKIIDCMQSDSAMLAIGPSEIASMEYIRNNQLGLTATSMEEAYMVLCSICSNPQTILHSIKVKNLFANKHHVNTSNKYLQQIKGII